MNYYFHLHKLASSRSLQSSRVIERSLNHLLSSGYVNEMFISHVFACLLQPAAPHTLSTAFPFLFAGLQNTSLHNVLFIELFHTANEAGIRGFLQSYSCWPSDSDLRSAYHLFQDIDYCFTTYREGICLSSTPYKERVPRRKFSSRS